MKSESYEFLKGFENNHINIGFGSYGQVRLAKNVDTKDLVAIKLIYNKNAKDEIAVHTRLEHPNIIKLLNYYYEKEKNVTYMVLQYADGGTLFEKIKTSNLTKDQVRKIYKDIVEAVKFLHKNGVMHRDIKVPQFRVTVNSFLALQTENILLTKKLDAKICDFGFAALCGERKTLCGTYEYMAPEMIQNMVYDHKIDIWALGILLFELIEGVAPFRGETPEEVLAEMKKAIYFSQKFTKQQIALVKSILRVNPGNRPSAAQILEHPYFQIQKEKQKQKSLVSTHASDQTQSKISYEYRQPQRPDSPPNSKPIFNPMHNRGLQPGPTLSGTASTHHLNHQSMQQQPHKNVNLSGMDYRVPLPHGMIMNNNPVYSTKDLTGSQNINTSMPGLSGYSNNSSFQNWRRN